jgi:LacI family transcriptional regulator
MATLKEVAREAEVSLGTVYNVLSGAKSVSAPLRRRVEIAARKLDYRPNHVARSLKLRQTHMLAMLISDIANPFFPEMVKGAEDAALRRGYMLTTFNTDDRIERERKVLELVQARRVDGLLVVPALPRGGHKHLREALKAGTRIVCLDRYPKGFAVDTVTVENEAGVESAVSHLVQQGHTSIGFIGGRPDLLVSLDRLRGFVSALSRHGLRRVDAWVREGDFRPESGYRLGKELLASHDRPSALFVANILMTTGVLRAMEELGLETPRDLALATFDHIGFMDAFRPRLTCVVQPSYEIGRRGADLLIDRLEGDARDGAPVHIRLATELRVRESSIGRSAAAT